MKRVQFFTYLILISYSVYAQTAKATVDINKSLAPISKDFWGSNFLYWIEDDASLTNDKLAGLLKEMPCTILRYPGGTVADNFHWKTATLDNVNMFPYESGEAESSFEEFMTFCKKVGAEPMLVVNTQSWFLKGKVDEGAQYAADWVKYCKEKGYKVRYWEIGNETYWHQVMTAREYGALVVKYSEAMKKIDPGIIISANGHWDIDMVGTKERTDKQFLAKFFESIKTADDKEISKLMKEGKEMLAEKKITNGEEKWWDNVLDVCGNHIDMISVHWYYHENITHKITPKLNELKVFITEKMHGKHYKWAMTEFNCNTDNDEERVLGFAEGVCKFLNFGFDVTNFWPMRIRGMEHRSMFSLNSIEPQYPYQIFQLFSKELRGNMVNCNITGDFNAFASVSRDQITVVVTGSSLEKETLVSIEVPNTGAKKQVSATRYTSRITGKRTVTLQSEPIVLSGSNDLIQVPVLPNSFVLVIFRK
jgi:hypothetical protein